MNSRRFSPPWSVEELAAFFVVRNHGGQKLAYLFRGWAGPAISRQLARQSFPAADRAYVGCTNCVAVFFRTALNDLAGVSQDGYCLSLIVWQL
jgi:hypothetical protein